MFNLHKRFRRPHLTVTAVAIFISVVVANRSHTSAQTSSSPTPHDSESLTVLSESTSIQWLEARIRETESSADLPDLVKSKVLELYRTALSRLELAQSYAKHARVYQQSVSSAPRETKQTADQLRTLVSAITNNVVPEIPPQANAKELEQLLATEQLALSTSKSELANLDQQLDDQQDRPDQAREQLTQAKATIEEIEQELKASPSPNEVPLLVEARRVSLEARKQSRHAEINMLEQELLSYSSRLDLLKAQRDLTIPTDIRGRRPGDGRAAGRQYDAKSRS